MVGVALVLTHIEPPDNIRNCLDKDTISQDVDKKVKNTRDFSHGMVRQELSEFKPVEMEVTKSVKQESRHFSDERFKTAIKRKILKD